MNIQKIKKSSFLIYLLYLLVATFLMRAILLKDTIGLLYDWGQNFFYSSRPAEGIVYIWDSSSNGSISFVQTGLYQTMLYVIANSLHVPLFVFIKIAIILLFSLMGLSSYLLLRGMKFGRKASFIAGLFYMTSIFFIIRLTAGYFGYMFSAALFPLLLLFYYRASLSSKLINKDLVVAILISLVAFSQIHFIPFFILIAAADMLLTFFLGKNSLKKFLALILIFAGYLSCNLVWFVGTLISTQGVLSSGGLNNIAFASRISMLPHALWNTLLLSDHTLANPIITAINGQFWRLFPLIIGLMLVFVLAYLNKKRSYLFLWFMIPAVFGLILSVGNAPPFENLYPWLVGHFSVLQMFRETYHLEYLLLLFYIVAIAIAVEYLFSIDIVSKIKNTFLSKISLNPKFYTTIFFAIAIFFVLQFNLLSLTGDFLGYLKGVDIPANLTKLNETINAKSSQRVFYPPGLGFWKLIGDTRHDSNYPDQIAESMDATYVSEASSDLAGRDSSWKLRNAAVNDFMLKDGQFTTLLPFLGSDLIVDRKYLTSYYLVSQDLGGKSRDLRKIWDAESNETKLATYSGLTKTNVDDQTTVYQLDKSLGMVYLADNLTAICNYSEIKAKNDAFSYVGNQSAQLQSYLTSNCQNNLESQLLSSKNRIDWGAITNLKHSANAGWSPGIFSFYENKVFSDTIDDFLFTRVPDTFSFDLNKSGNNDKLYLKYFSSPKSGKISINDQIIETKGNSGAWQYMEISPSESGKYIVSSIDGQNAFGGVGYVGSEQSESIASDKLGSGEVNYNKINPTKYEFNLKSNSAGDKLIILSENYNSGWKLKIDGKTIDPIMVNTYANGFLIPNGIEGSGIIEFAPQKLYQTLLFTSFGIVLLLIGTAIWMSVASRRLAVRS